MRFRDSIGKPLASLLTALAIGDSISVKQPVIAGGNNPVLFSTFIAAQKLLFDVVVGSVPLICATVYFETMLFR